MRLRFTIRDLLWLTTLVAMGVAWWIDRTRLADQYTTLKQSTSVVEFEELDAKYSAARDQILMMDNALSHNQK
jgi:hypothetical protein